MTFDIQAFDVYFQGHNCPMFWVTILAVIFLMWASLSTGIENFDLPLQVNVRLFSSFSYKYIISIAL